MTETRPATSPGASFAKERNFAIVVTLVFLASAVHNVSHHELWRDETRIWQLAAAAPTYADMRWNVRFEGAPVLWHSVVWVLTRLTSNMFAMQVAHVLVASGTVFLFAWRAPFARGVRLLFPFGYFTFFEYATITRSYAPVFLLVVAATAIIASPRPRPIWLAVLLGLLTQTSIWGAALACLLLLPALLNWLYIAPPTRTAARHVWLPPFLAVVGGVALCYLQTLPGPGPSFVGRWEPHDPWAQRTLQGVGAVWNGWIPVPQVRLTFWNSNVLDGRDVLRYYLSVVLFVVAASLLIRRLAGLATLAVGTVGLVLFESLFFVGSTRHHGHLFVVLIAAFWIGYAATPGVLRWRWFSPVADRFEKLCNPLLGALLAVHAVCGIGANVADRVLPFSAGKQIADYIGRKFPADLTIIAHEDYAAAPVGAYLRRSIYSAQMRTETPFFSQDDRLRRNVTFRSLMLEIHAVRAERKKDVLLVLTASHCHGFDRFLQRWKRDHPDAPPLRFVAQFDGAIVADEGAALYYAPWIPWNDPYFGD